MAALTLKYNDIRDKAYGIAGMAITLVVCEGSHLLADIDFDDRDGHNMHMATVFAAGGNPRMSAKSVWAQSIKDLRAVTSMALGNIACRRRMLTTSVALPDAEDALKDIVREQGAAYCALEADEADALFDSCNSYVRRIFSHAGIPAVAEQFSQRITDRRKMTAAEVVEYLASLGVR